MEQLKQRLLTKRREGVFGIAVLLAGLSMTVLCVMPVLISTVQRSFFPTMHQEAFFFDLFGIISGCWLLCWVSAINGWINVARVGQWIGIILLCLDQAVMFEIWFSVSHSGSVTPLVWLAPLLIQTYLLGCFFGFFTLPALTLQGNKTLTGLGTLVLLLPWLLAREAIVVGTRYLYGIFS